ncbi:MAG: MMPL family transporter [Steroidobacteraceae bacterium]
MLIGVLWLGLIACLAVYARATLRVSGDLRLFLPAPHTQTEQLILGEVSQGPASRLLMVALTGADAPQLAESSRRLAAALRRDPRFRLIENGANLLATIPASLLPYRYLLSPTLDHESLDAVYLHRELLEREQDLASPAASLLESWLPRDPTLETLKVLESWRPPHEPRTLDDVWFDPPGRAALLVVETAAPAFDPRAQGEALAALHAHFAAARTSPAIRLTATGPGAFSVLMQARTEWDARLASTLDTAAMIVLMLIAYRRLAYVALGALPLATGGVVALAVVTALFGTVHGITIAFGFTLMGVAIDYPIFLFSHQSPGEPAIATARSIWRTLAIAVVALAIAYLAFLLSGVMGLVQLACFNVAGLAAAGLSTRYLLPRITPAATRDCGNMRLPAAIAARSARLPRFIWLAGALALGSVAVLTLVPGPLWDNDLGHLTPVPQPLLLQYDRLRQELGAPDVRYLLTVEGSTADEVLAREEQMAPLLQRLAERRAATGFEDAARYLPSTATQERRRAKLPDGATLRAALDRALAGTAFRPDVFAPFVRDVERARRLPPLTPARVAGTPLELTIGSLLIARRGRWTGLVTFTDVSDPRAVRRVAAQAGAAQLIDLKQASENLVARQRVRIVWSICGAAILLALVVFAALRSPARALRVLAPMALTALLTLAILHAAGIALNLFHLIALVLAAGLGLDYGLFAERSVHDPHGRRRTLHAITVCAAAACTVFIVLASSSLPVLRSIGVTVVIGVVGNYLLALALVRPRTTPP